MDFIEERRRLTAEVFAVTGKKCAEDDPIIVAALFQAHSVREAGRDAVDQIAQAVQAVLTSAADVNTAAVRAETVAKHAADERKAFAQAAADERKAFAQTASAAQKALADSIDTQVKKAVRDASRAQSTQEGPPQGWRGVVAGVVLGVFISFGTMLVACNFRLSWFSDARFGAEWAQTLPSLDPALRDKMIEHYQKHRR